MVKCPKCNHCFALYSVICYRKVATTQRDKIKNLLNKQRRKELYNQILDIFNNTDKEVSVEEILNLLNLKKVTDGDVIRGICDTLICQGILNKTKFKKGRGGHRWKISLLKNRCPYFLTNNECVCEEWEKIEEREEIREDDNERRSKMVE